MDREISPSERARQILQEIELEENQAMQGERSDSSNRTQANPVFHKPVESAESPKNPDMVYDNSKIYSEEIGSLHTAFRLDQQSILHGVIFSEVLGKPRSMRRDRR